MKHAALYNTRVYFPDAASLSVPAWRDIRTGSSIPVWRNVGHVVSFWALGRIQAGRYT